jgi:predicted nuclease with TOPRIM domain
VDFFQKLIFTATGFLIYFLFLQHEVKEIEEKFRKAMIANAQLDNEKSALSYQVELLKDKLEDMEESHAQV